jgi:hypothetical protein
MYYLSTTMQEDLASYWLYYLGVHHQEDLASYWFSAFRLSARLPAAQGHPEVCAVLYSHYKSLFIFY